MSDALRQDWVSRPGRPLRGSLRVPGDKSVSHRAVMLGALAEGVTRIDGFLQGEDTRATARILGQLGVRIENPDEGSCLVHGVGLHGLRASAAALDCGNGGTGMRLLAGLLAGQAFDSVLVGDDALSHRPMRRVTEPLAAMGARIDTDADGTPPLHITGGTALQGIDYLLPIASAQVKSALLLAGLYADGTTVVREPRPTRDYTERMLAAFGWPIEFTPGLVRLTGGHRLHATSVMVPADFSSAAYFLVAASVVPGSELRLEAVGMNPRRTGLLQVLRQMGADITEERPGGDGGEPVADLIVRHAPLHGIEVPVSLVSDMIDEFPALFIAAACAEGRTVISGAAELRVKESDRIEAMANGLRTLGIAVEETADGAIIDGGTLGCGVVQSHSDHRIAMSFAVAGQLANSEVEITDVANVATSFPGFVELARSVGMELGRHD